MCKEMQKKKKSQFIIENIYLFHLHLNFKFSVISQ